MAELPPTAQFNFPAPPERVRRDGGSTSYGKLDPRQEANLADQNKMAEEAKELERRKLAAANNATRVQAEQDSADSKTAEDFHAVREKAIESSATEISAARDRLRANQAKYDNMPPASLFGGQGVPGQIAMSIGLAMGAYSDAVKAAAAIRLQRDAGASTVDGIIKHSFDRQRESAERVKDSVAMARTGVKDAAEAREALLADIDLKEASAYKVAARMTKARLASQGMTANQIASDGNVMALEKGRLDAQQKALEPLTRKISTEYSTTINSGGAAAQPPAPRAPIDLTVHDLDGKPHQARSLHEAEEVRNMKANADGISSSIKALQDHQRKYGRTFDNDAEVRRAREALAGDVKAYLPALYKSGVLNPSEDTRFNGLIDTSIMTGGKAASGGLDLLLKGLRNGYTANMKAKSILSQPSVGPAPATPSAPTPTSPPPQKFDATTMTDDQPREIMKGGK